MSDRNRARRQRSLIASVVIAMLGVDACRDTTRTQERDANGRLASVVACAFDQVSQTADRAEIEAAIRRGIRRDRMAFAERNGRCLTVLDDAQEPALQSLEREWSGLLTLVQRTTFDDIAVERQIRRVGNEWHTARALGAAALR